jgi:ankyrin repeat protein
MNAATRAATPSLLRLVQVDGCARIGELLDAGAQVDERDAQGRTPLLLATQRGDVDCARRLLAAGADPDARDDAGSTPRAAAAQGGSAGMSTLYGTGTTH